MLPDLQRRSRGATWSSLSHEMKSGTNNRCATERGAVIPRQADAIRPTLARSEEAHLRR